MTDRLDVLQRVAEEVTAPRSVLGEAYRLLRETNSHSDSLAAVCRSYGLAPADVIAALRRAGVPMERGEARESADGLSERERRKRRQRAAAERRRAFAGEWEAAPIAGRKRRARPVPDRGRGGVTDYGERRRRLASEPDNELKEVNGA